ncbi:S-adenosylmethionine-dependent methyltransferase [Aspergillus clavatus NRRL 1]|uniref:Diaminohydroxyphosphoribosylamino-pyrimidine deaminase n=1 Tax=Aspergillus clavatus (strain ATCC 1007 / CBS 513.65 / DSM 816 / NCTC 3887 / NRRL 1 / QM 1276 / 107) TaxID=344612 RepID=A1C651_ASPCL|nr:uncharacterized protein ACLA_069000 [Aspergillus clavatus NRRL 1]EAW13872.1 conserved hypothetical protein [Aspergillus clavatus NRRL 1]
MDQTADLEVFLSSIGEEVEDADEESFLLFSRDIPSANLGFVDSRATSVEITIHDQDYTINQSPTLLSSSRAGGTTGAVLWKITPLFAEWISASHSNPLWKHALLSPASTAVELGCGISGLIALTLGPRIRHYVATDQEYVHRLLRENLAANAAVAVAGIGTGPSNKPKTKTKRRATAAAAPSKSKSAKEKGKQQGRETPGPENVTFAALDWELDVPASLKESIGLASGTGEGDNNRAGVKEEEEEEEEVVVDRGFDVVLSCDCIYNEALVAPFVRTCAEFCRLRPVYGADGRASARPPTVCVIAQQQRSPDVFEAWLRETMRVFRVWRLGDEVLGEGLKAGTGYVVHLLLLKDGV